MTLFQNPFSFRWLDLSSRQCKWFCVVNEHYLAVIWSKVLLIPGLWIRKMSTFIKQFPLTMTSINSLRLSITAFEVICTIFTSPLVDRSPTMKVEWLVLLSFLLQWLTSSKYFSNQMRKESCDNFLYSCRVLFILLQYFLIPCLRSPYIFTTFYTNFT